MLTLPRKNDWLEYEMIPKSIQVWQIQWLKDFREKPEQGDSLANVVIFGIPSVQKASHKFWRFETVFPE